MADNMWHTLIHNILLQQLLYRWYTDAGGNGIGKATQYILMGWHIQAQCILCMYTNVQLFTFAGELLLDGDVQQCHGETDKERGVMSSAVC